MTIIDSPGATDSTMPTLAGRSAASSSAAAATVAAAPAVKNYRRTTTPAPQPQVQAGRTVSRLPVGGISPQEKGIDTDVYQWFIDRSDVIYIVLDINNLHLNHELQSLLEQLRGEFLIFGS